MNIQDDMSATRATNDVYRQRKEFIKLYGSEEINLRVQVTPQTWYALKALNPPGMNYETLFGMPVDILQRTPGIGARVVMALDKAPSGVGE